MRLSHFYDHGCMLAHVVPDFLAGVTSSMPHCGGGHCRRKDVASDNFFWGDELRRFLFVCPKVSSCTFLTQYRAHRLYQIIDG